SDMSTRRISLTLKVACCLTLLQFAPDMSAQRPPAPGKLSVTSEPPGANIRIDDQPMAKATNFTFVVSPGDHSVAITSPNLPKCAAPAKVTVLSGSLTSINCTTAGWGDPTTR